MELQDIEHFIISNPAFNKSNRKRRTWQDGLSVRNRYTFNARVFSRKGSGKQDAPYPVHEWISKALAERGNSGYVPNPDRPKMYDLVDGLLSRIDHLGGTFDRNDIVWVSFKISYVIGSRDWYPEIVPVHFVRVSHVDQNASSADVAQEDEDDDCELATGQVTLISGKFKMKKI
jgi:hypothetical protein